MRADKDNTAPLTAGEQAEALAADWLCRRGLRILERNFRVRGGEIDLVCAEGGTLVFVEVRLRRNRDFGGAAASITAGKRRRIVHAARHYLQRHPGHRGDCRFDCLLLDRLAPEAITWLPAAFSSDE